MPRKNHNALVELRARHHVVVRTGVGYHSADQGGGSGRLATKPHGGKGRVRYQSLRPEAGSNLSRAWS